MNHRYTFGTFKEKDLLNDISSKKYYLMQEKAGLSLVSSDGIQYRYTHSRSSDK